MAEDAAGWASARRVSPAALAAFSTGFGVIAAAWLSQDTMRGDLIAAAALLAAAISGGTAALACTGPVPAATRWTQTACALLTELAVYAGIASGARTETVWLLVVAALAALALLRMIDACLTANHGELAGGERYLALAATPGDGRLIAAVAALAVAGPKIACYVLLGLAAAALCVMLAGRAGREPNPVPQIAGFRGDGVIAVWIGRLVSGRLPPVPPLFVGLLVTGVLAGLGLRNLAGILVFTPVEAMLLAALASRHPHTGRLDWLAPPLIQLAEYVFLADLGFARHVWPAVTFALIGAVGLRHLDLASRARAGLASGIDRRGLGWEGRMLVAALATILGVLPYAYPALAVYLWWLLIRDWRTGWSPRRAATVSSTPSA